MKNLLFKRAVAYLLDILIINIIIVLPFKNVLKDYTDIKLSDSIIFQQDTSLMISVFVIMVLTWVYFSVLEYKVQQTIGKMVIGLYVYSKKPTFNKFLMRNVTKPFSILLIIDTIYLLIKKSNQRFTEKLSGTEVREI